MFASSFRGHCISLPPNLVAKCHNDENVAAGVKASETVDINSTRDLVAGDIQVFVGATGRSVLNEFVTLKNLIVLCKFIQLLNWKLPE